MIHLPGREAGQRLLDADPALHSRQGRAQAEVDAETQGHVVVEAAVDVEAVRVGELALVAVGGARREDHLGVDRHGGAVSLHRRGQPPSLNGRGSLIAQQLLHRARYQTGSSASSARWSGCSASTEANQPSRRATVSLPAANSIMPNSPAISGRGKSASASTVKRSSRGESLRDITSSDVALDVLPCRHGGGVHHAQPSSSLNISSTWWRIHSWSATGTPSIDEMMVGGRIAAKSCT